MSVVAKINGNLSGRAVLYMVGNLTLNFLSVLSAPLFVRLMTTEEYGLAAVYFTWVSILSNIISLRVDGTVQNARSEYGEKNLRAYCSSVLSLVFLVSIALLLVCAGIAMVVPEFAGMASEYWVLAVATAFFLGCSNVRMIYFTVKRDATGNLLVSLLLAVAQIVCSVAFLMFVDWNGFTSRVVGYSLPTIAIGLTILAYFLFKGRVLWDKRYWSFCLNLSIPLIFSGISYLVINQCDRLIINDLLGAAAAGIYSFAYSSALPISVMSSSLNTAWTPEYFDYMDRDDAASLSEHADRYMRNMTLIAMGLMLVSPEVLKILGTEEYYEGIWLVPLVVLAYYFQFLYTWPVNAKFYYKKTKSIAIATCGSAAVNIVLCYVLIPMFGMVGAALSSALAFVLLFLAHHISAARSLDGYTFKFGWYVPGTIAVLVSMIMTFALMGVWPIRWVIACGIGFVLLKTVLKYRALL